MKEKENKLRLMKQILVDDNRLDNLPTSNKEHIPGAPSCTGEGLTKTTDARSRKDRVAVSNLRHRRSQSADRWVDHRPGALVPLGTVLQPLMHRRRSVTRLTDPKEITEGVSRYCLVAQEHDTDGELETKLYKGDILPTSGGGAQVVFNDMECLKQMSPKARKRSGLDIDINQIGSPDHSSTLAETHSKRPRVIDQ